MIEVVENEAAAARHTAPPLIPKALHAVTMIPIDVVKAMRGQKSSSLVYDEISDGTMIEPIKLSARASRWLISEAHALAAARIGGATKEQLRALVVELRAARKTLALRGLAA